MTKALIKNAIVYKAELPDDEAVAKHLEEKAFTEMLPLELRSVGFVPFDNGAYIKNFVSGLAFRVRIDEKIIPASEIAKETQKEIGRIKAMTGKAPGKDFRKKIKEDAMATLAQRAFSRTAIITMFYHRESRYLIVATGSKKLSDSATSQLVHAIGSVKTETINVSDVKHGLTTRLGKWLAHDDDAFGEFHPQGEVALTGIEKRKITIKIGHLKGAHDAMTEALRAAFKVDSMGLMHNDSGTSFRLNSDFHLKSLEYEHGDCDQDGDTFQASAMIEVSSVVGIMNELCDMLSYKEEASEAQEGDAE